MSKSRLFASTAIAMAFAAIVSGPLAVAQTAPPPAESPQGEFQPLWRDISPFYGQISPFTGDVSPFWRDISPFWGQISPFEGDTSAFWGQISPFWRDISPFWRDIAPFWRDISPFMDDLNANWRDISPFDGTSSAATRAAFEQLIRESEVFWGATVQARTGQSFEDAFVDKILGKYGIDLNDPSTFEGFSEADRARFLFDWYDGLMGFSGRDHVDHWMKTANWSPAMTADTGGANSVVIGLVDFTVGGTSGLSGNVTKSKGSDSVFEGHGTAVASILVAAHDGRGIMGIAPNATVASYNPFASDGSASWSAVEKAISDVTKRGASVVNLSLGVPGETFSTEWSGLYDRNSISKLIDKTVFVHAAGNDGVVQQENIAWNFASDPHMIIVGSVGPTGQISAFSNTPGNACLLDNGVCRPENRLMNRFLVAPGEWILVDDGQGGVMRVSGTSFSAPIVTGAIALVQGRWSWLKSHPGETVDILFRTATDLGAPGIDPVYGNGLVNIGAALQPIDPSKLYVKTEQVKTPLSLVDASQALLLDVTAGELTVYEDIGATYRDFRVPLSNVLSGTGGVAAKTVPVQTVVASTVASTKKANKAKKGFAFGASEMPNPMGWDMRLEVAPLPLTEQSADRQLPYAYETTISSPEGVTLSLGSGMGAASLSGLGSTSVTSFDQTMGGANPVLGLASGGNFVKVGLPLSETVTLTAGVTERRYDPVIASPETGELIRLNEAVDPYQATGANVALAYAMNDAVSFNAGYTFLKEKEGVLGTQATLSEAFRTGAVTDAASLGVNWSVSPGVEVSGMATVGRVRDQDVRGQMLSASGLVTTGFETAIDLEGVFGKNDRARIALIQPMTIEAGGLNLTVDEIVDRSTGERGTVTTFVPGDGAARKLALEVVYAAPVLGGHGTLAGFVRAEGAAEGSLRPETNQMIGGQLTLGF